MTVTTEATADTTEARIKALEKRLNDIQYKRTPAAPAADLTFRRADAADIWLAVDPAGNVRLYLDYIPGVLVAGEICGTWFHPYDKMYPPVSDPDYAGLATVERVSIGG